MKQVSSIRARCTGAPSSRLRDTHLVGKWGSPPGGCSIKNQWRSFVALLESEVSLLDEAELDTLGGEEGDDSLLALANDEHVGRTGGEVVTSGVLNVGNVE